MNGSIFRKSKLENQLLKVSVKFKIHFLQFTNMRLLLTATKLTGSNTYFDVSYRKHFSQIDSLREACCVSMFSSSTVYVNEEYVKDKSYFLERNTEKENDKQGKLK